MGGLVRVKVSHLLISVVVLLVLSLANLGLSVFGNLQQGDIIRGQKVIEERVTPLCLTVQTIASCRQQINSSKRAVVVRLCVIVHERLTLPRSECENALAAAIERSAAASADGSRPGGPRGPPSSSGATGPGKSGVGSIPGGSQEQEPEPTHNPPGKGQRQPPPPQGGGGSVDQGPQTQGPQTPNGNQGRGQGGGSVQAEAEVKTPAALEVPPIVPKATEAAAGAVEGVRSGVEGALGH